MIRLTRAEFVEELVDEVVELAVDYGFEESEQNHLNLEMAIDLLKDAIYLNSKTKGKR